MGGLLLITRAVHIGAAILLFAVFVFSLAVGRPVFATQMEGGALDFFHRFECRLLRVALWSLAISFASGALWLWIEAAEMSERSLANALALDVFVSSITQRFSQVNFVMIGIIGATGVVNSWLLVSTFDAVLTSTYGRLLLLKLMLFAAMIALGAVNRYRLRPRLMPDSGKSYRALRALKRNVKFELCAGVAVILIVGAMGISAPPRHQD